MLCRASLTSSTKKTMYKTLHGTLLRSALHLPDTTLNIFRLRSLFLSLHALHVTIKTIVTYSLRQRTLVRLISRTTVITSYISEHAATQLLCMHTPWLYVSHNRPHWPTQVALCHNGYFGLGKERTKYNNCCELKLSLPVHSSRIGESNDTHFSRNRPRLPGIFITNKSQNNLLGLGGVHCYWYIWFLYSSWN